MEKGQEIVPSQKVVVGDCTGHHGRPQVTGRKLKSGMKGVGKQMGIF